MRIAILGATSQIAKDLILSFASQSRHELVLFARRPDVVKQWASVNGLSCQIQVGDFDSFQIDQRFDAILNFVGVGNPAQAAAMGASIFDVTLKYDELALNYVLRHPACRYLFLSSGAAYGSNFEKPVDKNTQATVAINNLQPQNWYAVAKLHAECRHRSLVEFPIIDVRIFNYFSKTLDISARFLVTDMLRAIRDKRVLKISPDYIVRDFLHPSDFYRLVGALLDASPANAAVDCYSLAPVDKPSLLSSMKDEFGLVFEKSDSAVSINATGRKPHYYSLNTRAAEFGYVPSFTSLEGVLHEARLLVSSWSIDGFPG